MSGFRKSGHICGTFGDDFNLVLWQIWLQSPNLMYANGTYNHMFCEHCTLNIVLFAKLKCPPMCITSQFAKLTVRQYTAYTVLKYIPTATYPLHEESLSTNT